LLLAKAHGEKCRTHVTTEQRAMLLIIGRRTGCEVDDCPLYELWQHRAKVFNNADSADAM
jgi:hypothetical protein